MTARQLLRRFRLLHSRLPRDDDRLFCEGRLYVFRRVDGRSWWGGPF